MNTISLKLFIAILSVAIFNARCPHELPQKGLCAHRGVNSTHPENTVPAFLEAVRLGAQQIELDVKRTKDNVLVIMHDTKVDRTTDGTGQINVLTFEERKFCCIGKIDV